MSGVSFRFFSWSQDEIEKKIEKWQELPPVKTKNVLPVPDLEPKKRRGGKRYRKMKEKYALSEVQKAANRIKFGEAEEEFLDGEEVVGLGMIGKDGSGKLRKLQVEFRATLPLPTRRLAFLRCAELVCVCAGAPAEHEDEQQDGQADGTAKQKRLRDERDGIGFDVLPGIHASPGHRAGEPLGAGWLGPQGGHGELFF